MRIIGVIDLLGGCAVHAQAGVRERYAPVTHAAGAPVPPGDARVLARTYIERLGIAELYVADLDAIVGSGSQAALVEEIAELGVPLWLDAGIRSASDARRAIDLGAEHLIVGLETLPSFDALAAICDGVRPLESSRVRGSAPVVAFSLDLRDGVPVVMKGGKIPSGESVETLVTTAADVGAVALVVIDLARVGTGVGVDNVLLTRVRAAAPGLTLVAGGGVRGWNDLVELAKAGCDGALVATALHEGRIMSGEIQSLSRL